MNNITGHFKDLNKEEWIEAGRQFIGDAKQLIKHSKITISMRDYFLIKAEAALVLAGKCFEAAELE